MPPFSAAAGMQNPQYYGQYFPTSDQGSPEWTDYAKWEANQPWMQLAGQAPSTDPTTGFNVAGSQRMADQALGNYGADLINNRFLQSSQDATGAATNKMLGLAMASRAQVRPDEMQNDYMAHDASYNQVLLDPIAALFERLGVRSVNPSSPAPPGAGTSGSPPPGKGSDRPTTLPDGTTVGGKPGDQSNHTPIPKTGAAHDPFYQNGPGPVTNPGSGIGAGGGPPLSNSQPGAKEAAILDWLQQIKTGNVPTPDTQNMGPIGPQPMSSLTGGYGNPQMGGGGGMMAPHPDFNNFLNWVKNSGSRPPVSPPTAYGFGF